MSYGKEQYFLMASATFFLVGAIFMLFNTFGGVMWALWVGIACASIALVVYLIYATEQHVFNKKFKTKPAEIEAVSATTNESK